VNVSGEFTFSTIGWGYFTNATTFVGTAANLGNSVTLALDGTAGKVLKVEFVSSTNSNVRKVFLVTLAGQQNFTFDLTGFGAVGMINFVSDQVGTTAYTVETKGLNYTPVVAGSTYSQALLTTLTGSPSVSGNPGTTVSSNTAAIALNQTSATTFSATSNVKVSGEFTFSTIGWGYFTNATTFVGTAANLENSVTLALNGTVGKILKVEFVSSTNSNVRKVFLVTLAGQQNFTFDLTGFGTVGLINFVSDQVGTTAYTVETKGLNYTPDAPVTAAPVTPLLGIPGVANLVGAVNFGTPVSGTTVTRTQTSGELVSWAYTINSQNDFIAGQISWGYFSAGGNFVGTPQTLTNPLVLGLSGTAGVKVKVEFVDESRVTKVFYVTLGGSVTNYAFDLSGLGRIGFINFVTDQKSGGTSGTIAVKTAGLLYIPPVASTSGLSDTSISHLSGLYNWVAYDSDGNAGTVTGTLSQTSATQASLAFNVSRADSYAGAISAFDDFGTAGIESQDLSSIGSFVLGLRLTSGTGTIEFLVQDAAGKQSRVYLTGVDGTERFYQIQKSLFSGIDWQHITAVVATVVQGKVSNPAAALEIRMGNHPYIPQIAADGTLTSANISHLAGLAQWVGYDSDGASSPQVTGVFTQTSGTQGGLAFDVTSANSFAGVISSFDNYATTTVESKDLSGVASFVVGLRLSAGSGSVEFLVEDASVPKHQSKVILTGVDGTERFYSIPQSLFSGIDLAHVTGIVMTVVQGKISQPKATLEIRFGIIL